MPQENEPIETGEPIAPLAELGQEVSPQFLQSVRKIIYRRTAANQMISFSWNLPRVILLEMMSLIAHFISGTNKEKAKS
jgi:hypothetical protein